MINNQFDKLLKFLAELKEAKIAYSLRHSRDDAIMVSINVPGYRWEVEFLEEGEIEIEVLTSDGKIFDETKLKELFEPVVFCQCLIHVVILIAVVIKIKMHGMDLIIFGHAR